MSAELAKVAVVCCYNRTDILESMLEAGLKGQTGVEVERLYYCNKFKSAAETFNHAISETNAEYFVFVHQDMKFLQNDFLNEVVSVIKENKDALYGLCGTGNSDKGPCTYSNVYHGLWNKIVGTHITEIKEVNGLDEIFLACHRDIFNKIRFDDKTFDGWHLYVEDICLQAQLAGMKVYALPLSAQHKNSLEMPKYMMVYGILPDDYFVYLKAIRKKYKGTLDRITSPCASTGLGFWTFHKFAIRLRFISKYRKFFRKLSMR